MDGWIYLSRYSARISEESWKRPVGILHCWQFPGYSCHRPRTGLANLRNTCSQWHGERFSWHAAFNAVPFFFIFYFYPTSVSILGRICSYVHISDYVETVHKLPLLPNYIASETFLHKSGVVRNAYWIFIVGAPAWRWLREYVTMDKKFYNFIFKRKVAAAPVTFTFTFLITFLGKTFLRKIIIIICINYNIYY